jgi:phospholipid/cholesterol/gamma-HCH transport system permease protein
MSAPLPSTPLPLSPPLSVLGAVGATARTLTTALFGSIGSAWWFMRDVARSATVVSDWRPHVMAHARVLGVDSLPIGIFLAVFTGIVLALLASYSISDLVPLYFVGTLVQKTVTMELAPVLTGLALAGRVGANIAAQIGTMRVTEQVDALETLAYDPLAYLVVPRVIASTVMFPVVVGAAMVVGVISGWVASISLLDLTTPQFVKGVRLFFETFDVRYGLVKSASFGFAVAMAGCKAGLDTRGGAEGVGAAATRAVVLGAILILVLDALWAMLWLTGKTLTH